ncbi:hypothetical protein WJ97_11260 [Burkholderia ubonensis]|uniref:Ig domain-containing protein n=1 Tax=Burkholderia ubonensis TaxID=101571 RepID=UPI00075C9013|nr:Ig domain-containing protein [Burkholderia ubonensis]KVP96460.1 hypothetical protein WJ97_11260 [Burkholderia ubonensis]
MLKKLALATVLAGTALSAAAASYYVVVPVPNRTVSNAAITVALSGYALPAGLVGTPYEGFNLKSLLSVTGDPAYTGYGVQWSLVSGSLPAGLTLDKAGNITGTPTANGTASFQVRASYKTKSGEQAYQIFVGAITVGLSAGTPPSALVGQSFSYDLKPLLTVTGDKAYTGAGVTWNVVSSTLPAGLYLTTDGRIAGTPTAASTGSITARATYKGVKGEQTYQVLSLDIVVALATATLPAAYAEVAYPGFDFKPVLKVSNDPNYSGSGVSWSVTKGSLPPGMSLGTDGTLTGTPTSAANYSFDVTASYKTRTGSQAYQVAVSNLSVNLGQATLASGRVGTPYSFDFKPLVSVPDDPAYASAQVSWSVSAGTLPASLTLNADGTMTGTPTATGSKTFTLSARYKSGTATRDYSLDIAGGGNVVLQAGGYRTWLDGSFATSCQGYLHPGTGYSYTGATGDGIYRVNVNGLPVNVYCDMTTDGGGWMMTMHAVANVTSTAYDATVGQTIIKGMALHTTSQDATNYPVLPDGLTNTFSQVLFKGGTTTWKNNMGPWVRISTFANASSVSTTYGGVLSASGRTAAYHSNIGWGGASIAASGAFSLWDAPGISPICGGNNVGAPKDCPYFNQNQVNYPYHYDTGSSRQLFVR